MPGMTNIVPAQMTRAQLLAGVRWLCNKLYEPAAFADRLLRQLDLLQTASPVAAGATARVRLGGDGEATRPVADTLTLLRTLPQLGPAERDMWARIRGRLRDRPGLIEHVMIEVFHYVQLRYMYEQADIWDPALTSAASPPLPDVLIPTPERAAALV